MQGSGTTEFTKAAIGNAHAATAAATTSLPIPRLARPSNSSAPLQIQSCVRKCVPSILKSQGLTRLSETAGQGPAASGTTRKRFPEKHDPEGLGGFYVPDSPWCRGPAAGVHRILGLGSGQSLMALCFRLSIPSFRLSARARTRLIWGRKYARPSPVVHSNEPLRPRLHNFQ